MSHVIKATDRNRGIHSVAFNFDDMAQQASAYMDKVRAEARKIIEDASKEAVAIRKRAEADGRREAQQQSQKTIAAAVGEQMQTALPALQEAARQIESSRQAWLSHWESRTVKLAAALAARVLRRELDKSPELPLALAREALQLAAGSSQVRVLFNPTDHETLRPQLAKLAAEFSKAAPAELLADDRISRGGCRVETQFGSIDQQFEAQLDRLESELT